jgi:1-deoxy-D-xylulose-5-phosphate synthase
MQYLAGEGLMDGGLRLRAMFLPDTFIEQETPYNMYEEAGLNASGIVTTVLGALQYNTKEEAQLA